MNSKGQEFSAFRLLIDAILVLLILIIIIGILGWVDSLRFSISEQRFYESFSKAVNSPNGQTVEERNLMFRANSTYLTGAFQRPGIPKECITFDAVGLAAIEISNNDHQINIAENIQLDVYYRCERQFKGDCEMECDISFGKDFE